MSGAVVGCPGEDVRQRFLPRHDGGGTTAAVPIPVPDNRVATSHADLEMLNGRNAAGDIVGPAYGAEDQGEARILRVNGDRSAIATRLRVHHQFQDIPPRAAAVSSLSAAWPTQRVFLGRVSRLQHARGLADTYGEAARWLIGRVAMPELSPPVLARALDALPGPGALRTLDAPHLASCAHLAAHGQRIMLASYDRWMNVAARAMEILLFDLEASQSA